MKTDAIVIGTELDGLIAATRLNELGHSVRIFSSGAGSLHYAPDGFHLLGYLPFGKVDIVKSPFDHFSQLDSEHPYQKLGAAKVKDAIRWYEDRVSLIHQPIKIEAHNQKVLSPAGQFIPACGVNKNLATLANLKGKRIALVCFNGHRDFPVDLIATTLKKTGFQIEVKEFKAPSEALENTAIACAFDNLPEPTAYFSLLKEELPEFTDAIVFPAVVGINKSMELLHLAEQILGVPCMELSTLPPSVPGMRHEQALINNLKNSLVHIHTSATIKSHLTSSNQRIVLDDDMGRSYESDLVVVSNGGVLMGGVEVDSYGQINEPIFGLSTYQSHPLYAYTVLQSLDALHSAGIETDKFLRPGNNEFDVLENLFVTGRSLPCWNPSVESSNEGVCISTGWAAAEHAHTYLEALHNV